MRDLNRSAGIGLLVTFASSAETERWEQFESLAQLVVGLGSASPVAEHSEVAVCFAPVLAKEAKSLERSHP